MVRKESISPVALLRQYFSPEIIMSQARRLGVVQRRSKIHPFSLMQSLVFALTRKDGQHLAGIRRYLVTSIGLNIARSAFWYRLTQSFEQLLQWALEQLETHTKKSSLQLRGILAGFTDVLSCDCSVIAVPDTLAYLWPATRWQMAAAVKVYTEVQATTGCLVAHQIDAERTSDVLFLKDKKWKSGALYLMDLGFSKVLIWKMIQDAQAFFVSRLKSSFRPKILTIHNHTLGRKHIGEELHQALRNIRRTIDVDCEFIIRDGDRRLGKIRFRVVGIWNRKSQTHHFYVTNLCPAQYVPSALGELYRLRWEVELFYKAAKGGLGLEELTSTKPHIIRTVILAALIRSTLAMQALRIARSYLPTDRFINPISWVRVWRELFHPLAIYALASSQNLITWSLLAQMAVDPNRKRIPTRVRCEQENLQYKEILMAA